MYNHLDSIPVCDIQTDDGRTDRQTDGHCATEQPALCICKHQSSSKKSKPCPSDDVKILLPSHDYCILKLTMNKQCHLICKLVPEIISKYCTNHNASFDICCFKCAILQFKYAHKLHVSAYTVVKTIHQVNGVRQTSTPSGGITLGPI